MGIYVNPQDSRTKETWLREEAKPITVPEAQNFSFDGQSLPVCLVDNGFMTAAGVAFDAGERDVFIAPDGRPKEWFVAEIDKLLSVTPERYHKMMGR